MALGRRVPSVVTAQCLRCRDRQIAWFILQFHCSDMARRQSLYQAFFLRFIAFRCRLLNQAPRFSARCTFPASFAFLIYKYPVHLLLLYHALLIVRPARNRVVFYNTFEVPNSSSPSRRHHPELNTLIIVSLDRYCDNSADLRFCRYGSTLS